MIDFKAKLNSYKKMLICALVDRMVEKASGSIVGKPPLLVSRVEVALHHANHMGRVHVNIRDLNTWNSRSAILFITFYHSLSKMKTKRFYVAQPKTSFKQILCRQNAECSNYEVIDDSTRSRGYQTSSSKCDDTMETKWYRFQGASGDAMPTSCVPKNRCGTRAPGWLHGTHPTVAHGIVSAKVCYRWGDNCCHWSNTIRVRNCDGFFVYKLNKTPGCNLRYCGNSGKRRIY